MSLETRLVALAQAIGADIKLLKQSAPALSGAKAWVYFNGGSAVIRAAFNVASVTRNAVGDYTINFATPMPNTNYVAVCTGGEYNIAWGIPVSWTGGGRTTNNFRMATLQTGGTPLDAAHVSVLFFGT